MELLLLALLAAAPAFASHDPVEGLQRAAERPDASFDGARERRDGPLVIVDEQPYSREYDSPRSTCTNSHAAMGPCVPLPPARVRETGTRQRVRIADRPGYESRAVKDWASAGAWLGGAGGFIGLVLLAAAGMWGLGVLVGLGAVAVGAGVGALVGLAVSRTKPKEFDRYVDVRTTVIG